MWPGCPAPAGAAPPIRPGVQEFARSVGRDPHRHGVGREIAAHQVVLEAIAEAHLGISGHLVVGVGAKGGDLQAAVALADADGAELDSGVPQVVGPPPQDLLHLVGARVGGEVQVGAQPAQQGIAHRTADEVELVARGVERRTQLTQHRRMLVERDRGGGQQLGILGGVRHVRSA
ncbi:polynucleotide adenylyltransferase/metal dependent phosphohydrolase domain protein [Mycobacterium avium subsp. avium 2285 (R)]|nr:polynucleotide adenylyltransferase/metal dependent phosphohydrolase domain protein [Mycobacterium avium subsp. avium 2285 (R)]